MAFLDDNMMKQNRKKLKKALVLKNRAVLVGEVGKPVGFCPFAFNRNESSVKKINRGWNVTSKFKLLNGI